MANETDALPRDVQTALALIARAIVSVPEINRHTAFNLVHDYCARLARENAELDASLDRTMNERDAAQDALADTHVALGGDGEWVARVPQPNPPDSGNLILDVPVLASEVLARAEKAEARVQELEREKLALTAERDHAALLQRRAEAELAAVRKRIAESVTATLRITYEEDRAMGVYLRDMDIGALCWLDGECVRLLPLDDEAKS